MEYWNLTDKQYGALARHVQGQVVCDIGAGTGLLAYHCVKKWGAKKVYLVEKTWFARKDYKERFKEPLMVWLCDDINKVQLSKKKFDVALLSWPVNMLAIDFVSAIQRAKKIIYIGSNVEGSQCGNHPLYFWLTTRKVLEHYPYRKNTMIVYENLPCEREMLYEEKAGLNDEEMLAFKEDGECEPITEECCSSTCSHNFQDDSKAAKKVMEMANKGERQ